jgi:hypothetical protein
VAALEARGDADDSSSYGDSSSTSGVSGGSGTRGDSPQGRGRHDVRLATSLKIIETVSCCVRLIVCKMPTHQALVRTSAWLYKVGKQYLHSQSFFKLLLKL